MDYNKYEAKLYGDKLGHQAEYAYITAEWIPKDGMGRPKPKRSVLLGPYPTEDKANEVGMQQLGNIPFEVIMLPTRDRGKATQMLRARKLNSGQDLDQSLQRVRHKT
jgi:hypothetical protein